MIKKLALAYETGWEYMPEGEEPGSVLMDIFLEMAEDNQARLGNIWEKQEQVFLEVLAGDGTSAEGGRGALLVKASGEEDGGWVEEGTGAYVIGEDEKDGSQGGMIRFTVSRSVQLTSAELKYAIYRKGLFAWLSGEYGEGEQGPVFLFQPTGEVIDRPVFRWRFPEICDGRKSFCFRVDLGKDPYPGTGLAGKWTVSDGENEYMVQWQQSSDSCLLTGETPQFVYNLDRKMYEIKLEIFPEEEKAEEWSERLCKGFVLIRDAEEEGPDLCLTDYGAGDGGKVLPFGDSPEEASCCYFACDRILAGGGDEVVLRFRESCRMEENLPKPLSEEYKKLYKKYPWMQASDTVREWQAEDTVWEYFNGNLWRTLPGSETWHTFCCIMEGEHSMEKEHSMEEEHSMEGEGSGKEKSSAGERERTYGWKRPVDMQPCVVDGETHLYIRLRLRKVCNAYAQYYRKAIPVMEDIRFLAGECRMTPEEQILPDRGAAKEEKMYFGFDRAVTAQNCWYTGEGIFSFDSGQIRGSDVLIGREAFWVELTEKKVMELPCFLPNYIPIVQVREEGKSAKLQIVSGSSFFVEPPNMGVLEAVCPMDICCEGDDEPLLARRQAQEHSFMHFGRLLTPMDMEFMLQERYPFLRVADCHFQQRDRTLKVDLALSEKQEESRIEEHYARLQGRLTEIQEWLKAVLADRGALWMRDCNVKCNLQKVKEQGRNSGNVGPDIVG